MGDSEFVTLTTTYDDPAWMEKFAQEIVSDRLAACVNILPTGQSVYRWEGKVETEPEGVAFIHTTRTRAPELAERIKRDHPYDEPQVLLTTVESASQGYAQWLKASVADLR